MSVISKIFQFLSLFAILHSAFSSYEYSQLSKSLAQSSSTSIIDLPIDIKYEAIVGLLFFTLSTFLSFEKIEFYPLRREEGKKLETLSQGQYLKYITLNKATIADNLMISDPTGDVSYTPNMVSIHEKRSIMKDWLQKNTK